MHTRPLLRYGLRMILTGPLRDSRKLGRSWPRRYEMAGEVPLASDGDPRRDARTSASHRPSTTPATSSGFRRPASSLLRPGAVAGELHRRVGLADGDRGRPGEVVV